MKDDSSIFSQATEEIVKIIPTNIKFIDIKKTINNLETLLTFKTNLYQMMQARTEYSVAASDALNA